MDRIKFTVLVVVSVLLSVVFQETWFAERRKSVGPVEIANVKLGYIAMERDGFRSAGEKMYIRARWPAITSRFDKTFVRIWLFLVFSGAGMAIFAVSEASVIFRALCLTQPAIMVLSGVMAFVWPNQKNPEWSRWLVETVEWGQIPSIVSVGIIIVWILLAISLYRRSYRRNEEIDVLMSKLASCSLGTNPSSGRICQLDQNGEVSSRTHEAISSKTGRDYSFDILVALVVLGWMFFLFVRSSMTMRVMEI